MSRASGDAQGGPAAAPEREWRLRVDPIACDGIGMCAHRAPDLVTLDSWGYPILAPTGLRGRELRQAKSAAAACPRRALFVQRDE